MTPEEYHRQMESKDRVFFISFPMLLLVIQVLRKISLWHFDIFKIIIGLRQFVNPEDLMTKRATEEEEEGGSSSNFAYAILEKIEESLI